MQGEILKEVRMAQRFYYLALKFEDKLPESMVKFAKDICNKYSKMAKEMEVSLTGEELIDIILK